MNNFKKKKLQIQLPRVIEALSLYDYVKKRCPEIYENFRKALEEKMKISEEKLHKIAIELMKEKEDRIKKARRIFNDYLKQDWNLYKYLAAGIELDEFYEIMISILVNLGMACYPPIIEMNTVDLINYWKIIDYIIACIPELLDTLKQMIATKVSLHISGAQKLTEIDVDRLDFLIKGIEALKRHAKAIFEELIEKDH